MCFPTVEQLKMAVFNMAVAGRIVSEDDGTGKPEIAIMMVEAGATEDVVELVAGGAQAPTETVVAGGLEAAKPFIAQLCHAQQQLASVAAKETGEFPLFPAYEDDSFAAVEKAAKAELEKIYTSADKQERGAADAARKDRVYE